MVIDYRDWVVPIYAVDFDGTLSITTPWFPKVQALSPLHVMLLEFLGPERAVVFTARKFQQISLAQQAIKAETGLDFEFANSKGKFTFIIDDRAIGSPPTFGCLLEEMEYRDQTFSKKRFEKFVYNQGFLGTINKESFLYTRRRGEYFEIILPLFSQSLMIQVHQNRKEFLTVLGVTRPYIAKSDKNTLTIRSESGIDLCERFDVPLMDLLSFSVVNRDKSHQGQLRVGVNKYPSLPHTISVENSEKEEALLHELQLIDSMVVR